MVCSDCRSKCHELTAGDALTLECPACNRDGCEDCDGQGTFDVIGCPRAMVTADVWDAITAQRMAEKGSWPVAGGWMDQAAGVVAAVQFIGADRAKIEADAMRRER